MSGADDNGVPPAERYGVGYGKPPVATRFQKGQSGNPNGRPRRRKSNVPKTTSIDFGAQPANSMLLEEAYRPVTIREGDKVMELPAIQAVFRAMGVAAMKGNRFAQRTMAELVQNVEEQDRTLRSEHLEVAIEYKVSWEKAIEHARATGGPEPQPLPHPDDVIIDFHRGDVIYAGPKTREEKGVWDRLLARRDEAQQEVSDYAAKYRKARDPRKKEWWLKEWHFEQRMFDIINDKLPDRYRTKLENRSWKEGASRSNPVKHW